jgi:hypothetical protein
MAMVATLFQVSGANPYPPLVELREGHQLHWENEGVATPSPKMTRDQVAYCVCVYHIHSVSLQDIHFDLLGGDLTSVLKRYRPVPHIVQYQTRYTVSCERFRALSLPRRFRSGMLYSLHRE